MVSAALTFGGLYAAMGKDFRKDYREHHRYECSNETETKSSTD